MCLIRERENPVIISYNIYINTESGKQYYYTDHYQISYLDEFKKHHKKFIKMLIIMCKIINLEYLKKRENCNIFVSFRTDERDYIPYLEYKFTNLCYIKELYINEFTYNKTPIAIILNRVCPINNFINLDKLLINNCVYFPQFFDNITIPLKTLILSNLYQKVEMFCINRIYDYKFDKLPLTLKEIIFSCIDMHNYNLQNGLITPKIDNYNPEFAEWHVIKPENFLFNIDYFINKFKKYIKIPDIKITFTKSTFFDLDKFYCRNYNIKASTPTILLFINKYKLMQIHEFIKYKIDEDAVDYLLMKHNIKINTFKYGLSLEDSKKLDNDIIRHISNW